MNPAAVRVPLCVDLDETLVRTNTLMEAAVALVQARPLFALVIPFWFLQGQSYCWARVARMSPLDVRLLPYNETVIDFLREQAASGRRIVLVTGAHRHIAERVASHCGLFSDVLASSDDEHLVRRRKADRLLDLYGRHGYDFVGATADDIEPCKGAGTAILAGGDEAASRALRNDGVPVVALPASTSRVRWPIVRALRPYQWVKNLIVFAPALLANRWTEPRVILGSLLAFVAFCTVCSGVYVINDILDLESDRKHPTKRFRPIAAGHVNILFAAMLAVAMIFTPVWVAGLARSYSTASVLAGYAAAALGYSISIKRIVVVDVSMLAGLYTLRLYAGGVTTGIHVSPWTLAFSLFMFLSLALMKRYSELQAPLDTSSTAAVPGRGYMRSDSSLVAMLGCASGITAVLVVALYITAEDTRSLYSQPEILMLLCPLVLTAIARLWIFTGRSGMDEDPVLFAIRDLPTVALLLCSLAIVFLAR